MAAEPDRVGVAVIGCGQIVRAVHLGALARVSGARVTVLADPDPGSLAEAHRLAPAAVTFPDPLEAIEHRDVDAVVVAAPSGEHARLAGAVLGAKRHLYLEKPVATSAADAHVLASARAEDRIVAVGLGRRFHPVYARARALVAEGRLGSVRSVHSSFHEPLRGLPAWKRQRSSGGGVLLDLGSHHADLARWLLADEAVAVSADVRSVRAEGDEASWSVTLRSGAGASGDFSFSGSRAELFELAGDRGRLRVDRYRGTISLHEERRRGHSVRRRPVALGRQLLALRAAQLVRPGLDPSFVSAFRAWIRAIRGGGLGDLATLDDGLRSLEVVLAAEHAAETGRRVELGPR